MSAVHSYACEQHHDADKAGSLLHAFLDYYQKNCKLCEGFGHNDKNCPTHKAIMRHFDKFEAIKHVYGLLKGYVSPQKFKGTPVLVKIGLKNTNQHSEFYPVTSPHWNIFTLVCEITNEAVPFKTASHWDQLRDILLHKDSSYRVAAITLRRYFESKAGKICHGCLGFAHDERECPAFQHVISHLKSAGMYNVVNYYENFQTEYTGGKYCLGDLPTDISKDRNYEYVHPEHGILP